MAKTPNSTRPRCVGEVYGYLSLPPGDESHSLVTEVHHDGWARIQLGRLDAGTQTFTPSSRRGLQGRDSPPFDGSERHPPQLVGHIPAEVAARYWRDERRSWIRVGNLYFSIAERRHYLVTEVKQADDGLPRAIECLAGELDASGAFRPNGKVAIFDAPPVFDDCWKGGLQVEETRALRASVPTTTP